MGRLEYQLWLQWSLMAWLQAGHGLVQPMLQQCAVTLLVQLGLEQRGLPDFDFEIWQEAQQADQQLTWMEKKLTGREWAFFGYCLRQEQLGGPA